MKTSSTHPTGFPSPSFTLPVFLPCVLSLPLCVSLFVCFFASHFIFPLLVLSPYPSFLAYISFFFFFPTFLLSLPFVPCLSSFLYSLLITHHIMFKNIYSNEYILMLMFIKQQVGCTHYSKGEKHLPIK